MNLLSKIGISITALGIISLCILDQAGMHVILSLILGVLNIIPGAILGWKSLEWGISPFAFAFMSQLDLLENRFNSALVWAVRFFFIPAIVICAISIITA